MVVVYMKCTKCNNEYENFYTNCPKCGCINSMYIQNISQNVNDLPSNNVLKKNTIEIILFVFLNIISFAFLVFLFMKRSNLNLIFSIIFSVILEFYFICLQFLLKRAYLPWWCIFIPFVNSWLLCKLAFKNGSLSLIPIVLFFLSLLSFYLNVALFYFIFVRLLTICVILYPPFFLFFLGKSFGRSGILTLLFSFVIIPTIAFSKKYKYI